MSVLPKRDAGADPNRKPDDLAKRKEPDVRDFARDGCDLESKGFENGRRKVEGLNPEVECEEAASDES